MCPHRFGCILPHGGPSSLCKIDSLIFFQPQGGRHSWLWISQSSWLDYLSTHFLPFISVFPTHPTFKDFTFSCSIPPVQWLFLTKLNIFLGIFYAFHSSLRGKHVFPLIWNAPQLKGKGLSRWQRQSHSDLWRADNMAWRQELSSLCLCL